MKSVAVVIPVLNAAATIGRQLDALENQTTPPARIVVADNGSTDNLAEVVSSRADVVDASDRRGAAHARNTGWRACTEPTVLFCDADDEVSPTWVEGMTTQLATHGIATGPINLVGWEPAAQNRHNWYLFEAPVVRNFLPFASSANLGVIRQVLDELDGFDTDFPSAAGEDIDFSWRAQLAGYDLGFSTDAAIDYTVRSNLKALLKQNYHWGKVDPLLYRKHRHNGQPSGHTLWGFTRQALGPVRRASELRNRDRRIEEFELWARLAGRTVGSVKYRTRYL